MRRTFHFDKKRGIVVPGPAPRERSTLAVKKTVHNIVSRALPKGWPYTDKHDPKGRPVFRSRQHIRECIAKAKHDGEYAVYDD